MPAYLVELDDGRKFRVEADAPPTSEEILSYLQAPEAAPPDQPGRLGSFASSVGRGALSVVPGTIGGVGYATGSDTLTEAADTIEEGINRMLPVNPEYQGEFKMKAGQAIGQALGMLGTGMTAGAVGKAAAVSRGLAKEAARQAGVKAAQNVMLGTGIAQGTRGGGQAAEQYGMQGGTAYARALLGGAIEGATERYLFGMGSELSPIGRMLGSGGTPGAGILRAVGTEAGEEAVAQVGGNLATTGLAPYGVQTPGPLEGMGEAALLGGIAGGVFGGVNAFAQSPTIEGEAMVPAETPPEQPETDDLGIGAFRQEMAEIAQNPNPLVPLQAAANRTAEASVAANANLMPATAAVIAAGGLNPAPAPAPAPVISSPVATLKQQPEEAMDAFIGRLNAQQAQLEQGLRDFAAETAAATPPVQAQQPPAAERNTDLFPDRTDFMGKLQQEAQLSTYEDQGDFGIAEYVNPDTGTVDVYVAAFGDTDYIAYIRQYDEAGKPTNTFTSKLERRSDAPGVTKKMLQSLQSRLPAQHQYTEDVSVSTDGLRFIASQLNQGYELARDAQGNPLTRDIAVSGESRVNDLPVAVDPNGAFENIRISDRKQFEAVRPVLGKILSRFGPEFGPQNVRWENGTVFIDIPVLQKKETPVGAPVVEQPASGVLLPQPTPSETFEQLRTRLRQNVSAEERADLEEKLAQAEDEGVLADVFSEERKKAAAREDFLRRQQDLEAERQRLEDEGILGDVFAEERQRALTREQPQPEPTNVEETVPPEQPIPAVEEVPAAVVPPVKKSKTNDKPLLSRSERRALETKPKTIEEADARVAEQQAASEFVGELRAEKAQEELRNKKGKFVSDNAADNKESTFLNDLLKGGWDKSLDDVQAGRVTPQRAATLAQAAADAGLIDTFTAKRFTPEQFPKVENVVAPEGEAGVGLEMEEPETYTQFRNRIERENAEEFQGLTASEKSDILDDYADIGQWGEALVKRAETEQLSEEVLDDYVDRFGLDTYAIRFRGKAEQRQYVPKVERQKPGKESLDVRTRGQKAADTRKAREKALAKTAAQAPTPEPAPPVQRDVTKPEQMTPGELLKGVFGASIQAGERIAEAFVKRLGEWDSLPTNKQTPFMRDRYPDYAYAGRMSGVTGDGQLQAVLRIAPHQRAVKGALEAQKPVSKAAVDAYKITLPEGYVQDGELYVYRPSGTVEAEPTPQPKPAAQSIADRLRAATSRAEAQEIVDSATHDQLKAAAAELNYTPKGTKKEIANRLVASVGSRADAIAIRDAGRPAQPPAPPAKPAAEVETPVAGVRVPPVVVEMFNAANESAASLRGRVSDVKFGPIEKGVETILFSLDGKPYKGALKGRNRDLVLGTGAEQDQAIAVRVLLAKDATPIKFGATNTVVTKETKDKAAKNLRKKLGGQTNVGLDPSILKDAIAIGAFYLEGGARSFAEFSAKMIEDFGAGVQKYIRPAYEALRRRTDIDTSGMDPEEGGVTAPKAEEPKTPPPPVPKAEAPKAEPKQEVPKPAPAAAPEPATVPIANDPVDAQRVALGLPPIMRQTQEAYTFPQMWADAEAAMRANTERGKALVTELNDTPRTISALEDAILLRERVNRVNALDLAMVEFNAAPKGNNETQRKAMDTAITELTKLDDALNVAGTEQGRSLNARKMLARLDYSLPKMLTTLRAANDGNLSEADVAMVTRLQKQIAEAQAKLAEVESGQSARLAEAEKVAFEAGRQEVLKDIEERAKADAAKLAEMQKRRAEHQAAKKEAATKPNKWAEIREAARARNAELRSNLYSDVVFSKAASMAVNDVIIGATYIAEGVTKLADWVTSMRAEGYNLPDAEMEQLFKESKAFDAGEDAPAAEAPLKTKKAKAPVIDRVKAIAEDEEQLDSRTVYNFVVEKMKARAEASQGAKLPEMSEADLTSVIREVTADVQAYFPDITEREIRDLFSGYGKILMPSQDELSKQVRQLSALGKLASAIEDAKAQIAPLKSGPQRDKATQAIRLQQKKLARELRMSGVQYAAGEGQLRSPLDAIKARLNNQINDLALEINQRQKIKKRPSVDYDKETESLVALRDDLKRISDEVNAPAGPTLEETVAEEMKKLDKRIGELQKLIAEGKFKPKEDTLLHTAELDAKREVRDGLNKTLQKMRKEAADKLRTQEDIDKEAIASAQESIAELERKIAAKDVSRPQRRTPTETAEYQALTARKKSLQQVLAKLRESIEGKRGMSDEQRIKLATAAIDKSAARIQGMLTSGNYEVPKRVSKTPETPELKAKRDARDALRKQLIELRKLKRDAAIDPIAKQIATDKKRIQTRMKKLQKRMDDGDFSKPVKKQRATDEALLKLQVEEEKLKEEWAKIVFERQLASRGPGKKILDATQQTLNTARAVLTSFDVSAVLRQGGFIVLGNPLRGLRNLGPMFKAFGDAEFAKAEKFRLQNRENYKNGLYQQSKLFLADTGKVNQMNAQEEAFMTRWLEKVPRALGGGILRGSQRAYTVFLNRLRADSFDAMVANLKKGNVPTPQEVAAVAGFINVATGRGDLGKFNQAGTMLNTVFFAPRLVASRFQILSGYPYFTASGRTKALVLREYAKFFAGAALVYALGILAQDDDDEPVETDPRSSDFLKIRFGDTRVDPLSGLIQATVFVSRLASGEKKTAKGTIVPIRGERVPYGGDTTTDVTKNFLRSKLSPIVGSVFNVLEGRNVVGEQTDALEELKRMVIPMSFGEAKETLEAQGIPEATALIMLQLFGMGVQTYTPGKK